MRVSELLEEKQVVQWNLHGDPEVKGLAYDSRKVKPGDLFFALRGNQTDGNRFAQDALMRGALAVVTDHPHSLQSGIPFIHVQDAREALGMASRWFFGDPLAHLTLIGVTGTNGKTSTAFFLHSMLQELGYPTGLMGTVFNLTPRRREKAHLTTPESLDIFAHLAKVLEDGGAYAVLEVSSHALAQNRVAGLIFRVALLTNITRDHLDFHGTFEAYWRAKQRLFIQYLDGVAVLPDFGLPPEFAADLNVHRLVYGLGKGADLRLLDLRSTSEGTDFTFLWRGKVYRAELPLPGRFQVYNALAALGGLLSLNFPPEPLVAALRRVQPAPGRFQVLRTNAPFRVVVDYAHTPDGLFNLIQAVRELHPRAVIVVFGAGGDRDRGKRPLMGKVAAELADFLVLTSDNPRTEDPARIIEDIRRGIPEGTSVKVILDRKEAISWALRAARPGDWVLIAGRGHEERQVIGTKARPFQDAKVTAQLLKEMGYEVHDD